MIYHTQNAPGMAFKHGLELFCCATVFESSSTFAMLGIAKHYCCCVLSLSATNLWQGKCLNYLLYVNFEVIAPFIKWKRIIL